MKYYLISYIAAFMISFMMACNDPQANPDAILILEIESSVSKINVEPADLPEPIRIALEQDYFETYIESASYVADLGYEVILGSQDHVYFRKDGIEILDLVTDLRPSSRRPCGHGRPIGPDALPTNISDFISDVYPDAQVLRAKHKGNVILVLISGRRLLVFDDLGNFTHETSVFYFCAQTGRPVLLGNLPDTIRTYLAEHCPDGELRKAWSVRERIVVGMLTPDGRKILVFDQAGSFLFQRN